MKEDEENISLAPEEKKEKDNIYSPSKGSLRFQNREKSRDGFI